METISLFRQQGWDFFDFRETSDPENVIVAPSIYEDGPAIAFNPWLITLEELEDPAFARLWIPMVLNHFSCILLHESFCDDDDFVGVLTAPRWQAFRDEICTRMSMGWKEILDAAEREGEEYTAASMALAMAAETRPHACGALLSTLAGQPHLRPL